MTRRGFFQVASMVTATALATGAAAQVSDEQDLEACIEQIKIILRRMHPLATEVTHGHLVTRMGSGTIAIVAAVPSCLWQGSGRYQVFENGSTRQYWIDSHLSPDKSRQLWGTSITADGHRVAPRKLIEERDLMRKLPNEVAAR
jgi:hypothetical protein